MADEPNEDDVKEPPAASADAEAGQGKAEEPEPGDKPPTQE